MPCLHVNLDKLPKRDSCRPPFINSLHHRSSIKAVQCYHVHFHKPYVKARLRPYNINSVQRRSSIKDLPRSYVHYDKLSKGSCCRPPYWNLLNPHLCFTTVFFIITLHVNLFYSTLYIENKNHDLKMSPNHTVYIFKNAMISIFKTNRQLIFSGFKLFLNIVLVS